MNRLAYIKLFNWLGWCSLWFIAVFRLDHVLWRRRASSPSEGALPLQGTPRVYSLGDLNKSYMGQQSDSQDYILWVELLHRRKDRWKKWWTFPSRGVRNKWESGQKRDNLLCVQNCVLSGCVDFPNSLDHHFPPLLLPFLSWLSAVSPSCWLANRHLASSTLLSILTW